MNLNEFTQEEMEYLFNILERDIEQLIIKHLFSRETKIHSGILAKLQPHIRKANEAQR